MSQRAVSRAELEPELDGARAVASPEAFRRVYQEHFDFVWRYVAHRGVPESARDDVVQEVFMVVYRRLPSFEGRSSLRTWIIGIALNAVRTHRRKTGNSMVTESVSGDLPSGDAPASETLMLKQALGITEQALARMTELQREAFVLSELDGLSGAEIAELLAVNVHSFRTRLRGARAVFNDFVAKFAERGGRNR